MAKSPFTDSSFHTGIVEELPFSTDATTSRVLVDNDALRCVTFTMGAGQELTEHASTKAVAVLIQEGSLEFSLGSDRRTLAPGDVVYLAPDAPHALVATSECRFSLVMVDPPSAQ